MDHLDRDDTNEMQQVLEPLYGAQVRSWNINIGVYEAFGQLVLDARQCRPAMELVPAPYHVFTPQKWARRSVRRTLTRYFSTSEGHQYLLAMRAHAERAKPDFDTARAQT